MLKKCINKLFAFTGKAERTSLIEKVNLEKEKIQVNQVSETRHDDHHIWWLKWFIEKIFRDIYLRINIESPVFQNESLLLELEELIKAYDRIIVIMERIENIDAESWEAQQLKSRKEKIFEFVEQNNMIIESDAHKTAMHIKDYKEKYYAYMKYRLENIFPTLGARELGLYLIQLTSEKILLDDTLNRNDIQKIKSSISKKLYKEKYTKHEKYKEKKGFPNHDFKREMELYQVQLNSERILLNESLYSDDIEKIKESVSMEILNENCIIENFKLALRQFFHLKQETYSSDYKKLELYRKTTESHKRVRAIEEDMKSHGILNDDEIKFIKDELWNEIELIWDFQSSYCSYIQYKNQKSLPGYNSEKETELFVKQLDFARIYMQEANRYCVFYDDPQAVIETIKYEENNKQGETVEINCKHCSREFSMSRGKLDFSKRSFDGPFCTKCGKKCETI